jgi:hypothetical protein
MVARLEWPRRWMSADGVVRPIAALTTEHLWAILGYLRWYAPALMSSAGMREAMSPVATRAWLVGRPVWTGIAKELLGRAEIPADAPSSDSAWRGLERSGAVPWEPS